MEVDAAIYWLSWIKLGKIVAFALVALGVAAEFIGEFLEKPLEKKIEDARELTLTELRKETVRLSAEAESARADIAAANARALEAQLALEKFRAPRELNQEQIDRVANKARQFQDVQFDLSTNSTDPELLALMEAIERAVKKAGWTGVDWTGFGWTRPGAPNIGTSVSVSNVVVGVRFEDLSTVLWKAAGVLAEALRAEGIEAIASPVPIAAGTNTPVVHIMVGPKR